MMVSFVLAKCRVLSDSGSRGITQKKGKLDFKAPVRSCHFIVDITLAFF